MTTIVDAPETTPQTELLILTPSAVAKASELLRETEGADLALRVAVKPGGCSGLNYDGNADVKVADFEEVLI